MPTFVSCEIHPWHCHALFYRLLATTFPPLHRAMLAQSIGNDAKPGPKKGTTDILGLPPDFSIIQKTPCLILSIQIEVTSLSRCHISIQVASEMLRSQRSKWLFTTAFFSGTNSTKVVQSTTSSKGSSMRSLTTTGTHPLAMESNRRQEEGVSPA